MVKQAKRKEDLKTAPTSYYTAEDQTNQPLQEQIVQSKLNNKLQITGLEYEETTVSLQHITRRL